MLTFTFRRCVTSFWSAAIVLAGSLLTAYSTAVIVNATRITIAIWLMTRPLGLSRLTPAQGHRVEGIIVYFAGLVILHELILQLKDGVVSLRSGA